MASAETLNSLIISGFGTGITGAVVWWINHRREKKKEDVSEYDADVRARSDVYTAFQGIVTALREELMAERAHSRQQDLAILDQQRKTAECEEKNGRLELLIQHLRARVSILERMITDSGSTRLDSDYDYRRLQDRDGDKDS